MFCGNIFKSASHVEVHFSLSVVILPFIAQEFLRVRVWTLQTIPIQVSGNLTTGENHYRLDVIIVSVQQLDQRAWTSPLLNLFDPHYPHRIVYTVNYPAVTYLGLPS
jgi:hypothetical protein